HRRAGRRSPNHDAAAADRTRPADDHPRHVRRLARDPEVRALAVGPVGATDQRAGSGRLRAVPPPIPLVSHRHGGPGRADHHRALAVPEVREVRHLDPGHDPGPRHGAGHGHSRAAGLHRRLRNRLGDGGSERRALRPVRRRHPDDGLRLHASRVHRGRGRRHGEPRRLDPRLDLREPARVLRRDRGEPGPGGDRLVHRTGPDHALPAHRALRPDAEMTASIAARPRSPAAPYWTGFAVVVALLVIAPIVLPPFWQRFATEILIWGLLAMSSDILIGYPGMVSFGHSAFFGLGMYGAAAALLTIKPPSLGLAVLYGLVAAGVAAVFVAYFATRLRDIYFAISTLVFSQIFYVIIFTWTEVTGGESGLTFGQPRLSFLGLWSDRFTSTTFHWFVLAVVV